MVTLVTVAPDQIEFIDASAKWYGAKITPSDILGEIRALTATDPAADVDKSLLGNGYASYSSTRPDSINRCFRKVIGSKSNPL